MSASLRRVLDRAILRTVLVTSGAVVAIGLLVAFAAAMKQDDDEAVAIASNLGQEIDEGGHANARAVFAKESGELALGSRRVEAFDGSETLGDAARDSGNDGCTFDGSARRCRASTASYHVVVVTPLRSIALLAAADTHRVRGERFEIPRIGGECRPIWLGECDDERIDGRTGSGEPAQLSRAPCDGFGDFLDDVAGLQELVRRSIAPCVTLKTFNEDDGGNDRWPQASAKQ